VSYARQELAILIPSPPPFPPSVGEQEQETYLLALTGRYALSDRFQIEAGSDLSHGSANENLGFFEFEDLPEDTRFGDLNLGASYQLLREQTAWPAVFLSGTTSIPTDGSDVYSVGGQLALTKRFDPTTLFGSAGYTHVFNADNRGFAPDDYVTSRLGFVFGMNDRLALRMALDGIFFLESEVLGEDLRSDNQFDLSFALPIVLSDTLSLEPNISFGLDQNPGNRFGLGLSLISNFSVPALF
jgi:hypothetical protein